MSRSSKGYLDQAYAVWHIERSFGEAFVYDNENGNRAINKAVLKQFWKLTESTVVWDRADRAWRAREAYDGKDRQAE